MEFFTHNLAPIMFLGLICFLLMGFPVAFSLGACGLFFAFIGIELNPEYIAIAQERLRGDAPLFAEVA